MKKIFKNNSVFHLIMGFLLSSLVYLYSEYKFERKTLLAFVNAVVSEPKSDKNNKEQTVLTAMNFVHQRMRNVDPMSMHMNLNTFEQFSTSPTMQFALTKEGACGGNSLVLAQVLNELNFNVKPGQMKVNGRFGGHIILEVQLYDKWVVMDPLYNLVFRNKNNQLASFYEVQNNWADYSKQVPKNYNYEYKYDDIQFTNWSRAPILGGAVKWLIDNTAGKSYSKQFSVRSFLLNPKKILFFAIMLLTGLISFLYHKRKIKEKTIEYFNSIGCLVIKKNIFTKKQEIFK